MVKRVLEKLIQPYLFRKKSIVIYGARQVGKTYILKEFGNKEYLNIAYINFEQDKTAKLIFAEKLSPHDIIIDLSIYLEMKIQPGKTLIFFDEIQNCPLALTSLKYFCEDAPEYHVVAAGSLLGIKIGASSSFPVGKVDFLELVICYPVFHLSMICLESLWQVWI